MEKQSILKLVLESYKNASEIVAQPKKEKGPGGNTFADRAFDLVIKMVDYHQNDRLRMLSGILMSATLTDQERNQMQEVLMQVEADYVASDKVLESVQAIRVAQWPVSSDISDVPGVLRN